MDLREYPGKLEGFETGKEYFFERPLKKKKKEKRIEDLKLSVRVKNACLAMGINTTTDLAQLGINELLNMRNFGKKSFIELQEYIEKNKAKL